MQLFPDYLVGFLSFEQILSALNQDGTCKNKTCWLQVENTDNLVLVLLQFFLTARDVFVKELELVLKFYFFLITTTGYNKTHRFLLTVSYLNKLFHNTGKHQSKTLM